MSRNGILFTDPKYKHYTWGSSHYSQYAFTDLVMLNKVYFYVLADTAYTADYVEVGLVSSLEDSVSFEDTNFVRMQSVHEDSLATEDTSYAVFGTTTSDSFGMSENLDIEYGPLLDEVVSISEDMSTDFVMHIEDAIALNEFFETEHFANASVSNIVVLNDRADALIGSNGLGDSASFTEQIFVIIRTGRGSLLGKSALGRITLGG